MIDSLYPDGNKCPNCGNDQGIEIHRLVDERMDIIIVDGSSRKSEQVGDEDVGYSAQCRSCKHYWILREFSWAIGSDGYHIFYK